MARGTDGGVDDSVADGLAVGELTYSAAGEELVPRLERIGRTDASGPDDDDEAVVFEEVTVEETEVEVDFDEDEDEDEESGGESPPGLF